MLVILLAVVLLTQAVSALLDLNFQGVLQTTIPNVDQQTAFSGRFFAWLNVASFVMQFAVTPLLLRWLPLGAIHLAIPLVHVASCAWLLESPSLFAAGLAFTVFKAIDYSTFRAAKEILYIPLPFDARYRERGHRRVRLPLRQGRSVVGNHRTAGRPRRHLAGGTGSRGAGSGGGLGVPGGAVGAGVHAQPRGGRTRIGCAAF